MGAQIEAENFMAVPASVPMPAGQKNRARLTGHVVRGVVEPGDQRGRLLGFPTANVSVPDHRWRDGVWAGVFQVDPDSNGPVYVAAVSIGRRPTYYGKNGQRLLEAHLLDFSGDIYGKTVVVTLLVHLRPQRRYEGSTALVHQLQIDVENTRSWAEDEGWGHLLRHPSPTAGTSRPEQRAAGRRYPVGSKNRPTPEERKRRWAEQERRRQDSIRQAVADCLAEGKVTHRDVAERTGLPDGYIKHRFPTQEALLAVTDCASAS